MFCYGISLTSVNAQDIHWSQFRLSPMNLSPAATAIFKGDVRFIGSYRNQWANFDRNVDYTTFSGSVDMKFFAPKLRNSMFGGGLIFNHDSAGDLGLSLTQIGLNGSYTHQLGKQHFLTLGLQGSFASRRYSPNLTVDNQWNGDTFDASLPTREPVDEASADLGDFSAGINYHFQKPSKRSKLDVGVALFHVNKPTHGFYEDDQVIYPQRLSLYALGTIGLGKKIDLLPMAMRQEQGPHSQTLLGLAGRLHLNQHVARKTAIQLGLNYRFNELEADAWIPNMEFHFRTLMVGLSYDINISEYVVNTANRGGLELHVNYIIDKVRLDEAKICPIY